MKKGNKITIYKIAEELGISPSTVSRALNNKGRMKEELRNKILELAKEYNYIPNEIAKGLKTKSTKLIGLIIPDIANPYYVKVAKGTQDGADKFGYTVAICNSENKPDLELKRIKTLLSKQIDGLLLFNFYNNMETIKFLENIDIPVVLFNPPPSGYTFPHINHDLSAINLLLNHFLERGYKDIAHIAGDQKTIVGKVRLLKFLRFINIHKISIPSEWIIESDFSYEGGYLSMKKLLSLKRIPRAVWCANDLMAIGAMTAIMEEGLKIPKDIAIAGCDDIEYATLVRPKLTTIHKPKYKLGISAINLLMEIIKGYETESITLCDELIIREST
jgi:DNA-binding LacI/PurR family transcriptional regulator